MKKLHNQYFAMRHGESKANVVEMIISHLDDGIKEEFTLTKNGEEQVIGSVKKARAEGLLGNNTIIYSSPFSRCRRTAEIAKEVLGVKNQLTIDDRLQERWFGILDKTHISNYQKVWNRDKRSSLPIENEESVESVKNRAVALILELEKQYTGETFLLVSHGDVLQILETYFCKLLPQNHRDVRALQKAEIRELKIK